MTIRRFAFAALAALASACGPSFDTQSSGTGQTTPVTNASTTADAGVQTMTVEQAKAIMDQCGDNNWCTFKPGDRTVVVENKETGR